MAVIPYLRKRMIALGIPSTQADLMADTDAVVIGDPVDDLAVDDDLETAVAKVNELLAALRAAGVIEDS